MVAMELRVASAVLEPICRSGVDLRLTLNKAV